MGSGRENGFGCRRDMTREHVRTWFAGAIAILGSSDLSDWPSNLQKETK